MKIDLEKILKKNVSKENSATLLLISKTLNDQIENAEKIARKILKLQKKKNIRSDPDCFGIWPQDIVRNSIKIEQIHEFIRQTQLKPFSSQYKVGIIIAAEKLTPEAQNALLKTLEEPSKNTFLLLTTSQLKKLLPTLISRCQVLEFDSNNEDKLVNKRVIMKILDSSLVERFVFVEKIMKQKDKEKVNEDIEIFLSNLLKFLRVELLKKRKDKYQELIRQINLVEETRLALEKNVNTRLALESLMINLPRLEVEVKKQKD